MCHIFFIHSSVDGHLGCFHFLAALNIGVRASFQITVFIFFIFGYIPRNRIVGSYSSSSFIFLRNRHAVFYGGCTNLRYYQQRMRVPFSPHIHQHLLFVGVLFVLFLLIVILTAMRCYPIVVFFFNFILFLNFTKLYSFCQI